MFHKVKAVSPLPDYVLLVHFTDGTSKRYSVAPLLQTFPFSALAADPALFSQVTVDPGGYGISWNDELDLDASELWANGVPAETPFDGLLSFSDAAVLWSLNESTLRKAVSYGKLRTGVDALNFGRQWVITKSAMLREYGAPKLPVG